MIVMLLLHWVATLCHVSEPVSSVAFRFVTHHFPERSSLTGGPGGMFGWLTYLYVRSKAMARKKLSVIVGLVASLVFVGAALAEGSFDSFISGGRPGFESRRWTDNHNDNNDTTVTLRTCRASDGDANPAVGLKLWRDIPLAWDEDRGWVRFLCGGSGTGFWSAPPNVGNYYFNIIDINGRNDSGISVDVPSLTVTY